MADIRCDRFGGIPLLYDRSSAAHYGVGGVPFRPMVNSVFAQQCDACFSELIPRLAQDAGLTVTFILSGGVSRAGQGASYHHKNRAFDFDGLLFQDGSNWVANTFPARPQLYLGLEAILRKHFGTVLSFDYNRAHEDHFHFDNGTGIGFKTAAKTHVIFLQNVIALVFGIAIGRDGVWGPETQGALGSLRTRLGIGPISVRANWLALLDAIAQQAMGLDRDSR